MHSNPMNAFLFNTYSPFVVFWLPDDISQASKIINYNCNI